MADQPDSAKAAVPAPAGAAEPAVEPEVLKEQVIAALQQVYDPEIPVSIYELGLIYAVDIQPSGDVKVTMTLTAPSCPAAQDLPGEVRARVGRIPGVKAAEVEITFEPPWRPEMMSEAAKVQLGFM